MAQNFEWLVVGAGPAGIAALGGLLDSGVPFEEIAWVDPEFRVGDLGGKWQNVPSNTKVELFLRFLNGCRSFDYDGSFPIDRLDPQETCFLREVCLPLQKITDRLRKKVTTFVGVVESLEQEEGGWEAKMREGVLRARGVVLAVGSEPKVLDYAGERISLECALNPDLLAEEIEPGDVVAVFGSSHSAVLVLANLMNTSVKTVYNFYRSPHRYAVYYDGWILYDDIGLKGFSAKWGKEHLDGVLPERLKRVLISDAAFLENLARCNKVVSAIGFEKRELPLIEGNPSYCKETGMLAPGLFGCGIAYPQMKLDRVGNLTQRIGLWKFMDDLNALLPAWINSLSSADTGR